MAYPKSDCTVSDCIFSGNAGIGVSVRNEAFADFSGNILTDNAGGGLDIESGAKGSFFKNHIFANKTHGTRVEDAGEGISFKGNITQHHAEDSVFKWLSSTRGSAKAPLDSDNAVVVSKTNTVSDSKMTGTSPSLSLSVFALN